jgi:integrase/recombinase XerD
MNNINSKYNKKQSWCSTGIPSVLERQEPQQQRDMPPGIPYSKKVLKGDKKNTPGIPPEKINREYKSKQFIYLAENFVNWLETLGYSKTTVKNSKNYIAEFFAFLEKHKITSLKDYTGILTEKYMEYIHVRPNLMKGGGLSPATINLYINTLRSFTRYLHLSRQSDIVIKPKFLKKQETATYLTKDEIAGLYKAAGDKNNIYNLRDTAMLSIFYGCGLRASEGEALNINDVLFEKSLLFVRKGKGYTQRYVPISQKVKQDLKDYIINQRGSMLTEKNEALFINRLGKKLTVAGMYWRLQVLKNNTNDKALKEKSFGLHILRHSIATHLLQSGMKLDTICSFLGHKTLETTQKYVHLVNDEGF